MARYLTDQIVGKTKERVTVQYDEIMQHADFEDAVYVLMP
jgi:hypothetical protein